MEIQKTNGIEQTTERDLHQQMLQANRQKLESIDVDLAKKTEMLHRLKTEIEELNKLQKRKLLIKWQK